MTRFTRRDAVLIGLTGLVGVHFTSQAEAQDAFGVVTGRTLDHNGDPAKKVKCYLSGPDKIQTRGNYDDETGEFNFAKIPEDPVLVLELVYNGQPFTYPYVNPSAKSRLEIRFPQSAREWAPNQRVPKASVVTALGSIASFALKLRTTEEILADFLTDGGYADINSTLMAIGRTLEFLDFAGEADRQLVNNLFQDTLQLWGTFE